MLNKFWRTLSLNDKKWNGFVLVAIVFLSGFIGIYGIIIPSLLNGPLDKDSPLDRESESNLGYEEMIRVNIDRYGNLTVHGSFQGPQVTPNVNWALPEYDAIYMLQLDVVNPNTSSSFYKTEIQALNPVLSRNDVYLHIFFLIDVNSFLTQGMAHPFAPNPSQRLQIAATVKNDLEQAFGISNNFTANPIGDGLYWDQLKVFTYAFNFSAQINYDYFLQYFADHTPSGLADSFSMARLRNTHSWLNWAYTSFWAPWTEKISTISRLPLADFNSSFELNVLLKYPKFFGAGYPSFTEEQFNLSEVIDVPLIPIINLDETFYSSSEIEILVENGNITSTSGSLYHIPRYLGLDHDWWLLQNTTEYHSFVTGLGSLSDISVSFIAPLINLVTLQPPPPPTTVNGNVNLNVNLQNNGLPLPSYLFAEIIDEATFHRLFFDDGSYQYRFSYKTVKTFPMFSIVQGFYTGIWMNSYHAPNGNYYLYVTASMNNLSSRVPRGFFFGNVYNYSRFTLNNPLPSNITVLSPLLNAVVSKNVTISVNITNPALIQKVEYLIINHTEYFKAFVIDPNPMVNGSLNKVATTWTTVWNSVTVPSTDDYILRIKATDTNDAFFKDIPITVNNTLFQENIPLYAPMGAQPPYGYELNIGTIETPSFMDPWMGGGGGGPNPHSFFGFGVNFGMNFTSLFYRDVAAVFFMADNDWTTNPLWNFITDLPEIDYGMGILMPDDSLKSQLTSFSIMRDAKAAFNIPADLIFLSSKLMNMGGGNQVYFFLYGGNYSTITYEHFIDKFHASVPSGLADLYTKQNMTQTNLNSSLFFGWVNPNQFWGVNILSQTPYKNYNLGFNTFISPSLRIPSYFDSSLGSTHTISLKKVFPQISRINACAPTVASTVLSGFGPNIMDMPLGAIVLNANITDWYPKDPFNINVTPLYGFPIPSTKNIILFTMLNTANAPIGLIQTDDIRLNFTGPFITNNILSPTEMQSVQLEEENVTIATKVLSGFVNNSNYDIRPLHGQDAVLYGYFINNGQNLTHTIESLNLPAGPYVLHTYVRDNRGLWALNSTIFYVNNTGRLSSLDIYINDVGDVEIGYGIESSPSFGYGMKLGIDTKVFNSTEIFSVEVHISDENTSNAMSTFGSSQNWNVLVIINGQQSITKARLKELAGPIIADLERVFNIPSMIHELEGFRGVGPSGNDRIAFAMNYSIGRDYNYFLDHYETVRSGNISNLFSKENILRADQSYISYQILPEWFIRPLLSFWGIPILADVGDLTFLQVWMRFEKVYDYSVLNQPHQFSLAQFLGIQQINTNEERTITSATTIVRTHVACGQHTDVYPNHPNYTVYEGGSSGYETYRYELLSKNGPLIVGLNSTDDIRFNFTAPHTSIQIISPLPGSVIHGDVEIIADAIMEIPATNPITLYIRPAGAYMAPPLYLYLWQIKDIVLPYDPVNGYWLGIWETLKDEIPNGWYDLIFNFQDGMGREQRAYSRVYLQNTYYRENLELIVEQNGNVSAGFNFQGNAIKDSLDYSVPEYQDIVMASFMAVNAFNGSGNLTKRMLQERFQGSQLDFGLSVLFSIDTPYAEALLLATPIKNDFERAFGLIGMLSYVQTGFMTIPTTGSSGEMGFLCVTFGNNYTPSITYDYFISRFHRQLPSGLNNSLPAASLKATESLLMWVAATGSELPFPKENPPTIEYAPLILMSTLFYPQYLGSNFMGGKLTSHSLSFRNLFNVPQLDFASLATADSFESRLNFLVENGNITNWYPSIPEIIQRDGFKGNSLFISPASRNMYQAWDQKWDHRIYSLTPWDDINITFEEPISRPIILTPSASMVIDGTINMSVLVQSNISIQKVYAKIYTESEFSQLESNRIFGGDQRMPYIRPQGTLGQHQMAPVGGGVWNYSWHVNGLPNGPYWLEFEVETQNQLYSYNSTRILISNSNPLAITVLTPSNGAIMSGFIELRVRITNSTSLMFNAVAITKDPLFLFPPLWQAELLPLGGNLYSVLCPSQTLSNGTYRLVFMVADVFFVFAYNTSISIEVWTLEISQLIIASPTNTFEWSQNAQFMVTGTRPFHIMQIGYTITQRYFDPLLSQWSTTNIMGTGEMIDPNSSWIATVDSTYWDYRIQGYDGRWYDAYYNIDIQGMDTSEGIFTLENRFSLGPASVQLAEITSPLDFDLSSGDVNILVSSTNLSNSLVRVYGEVRRISDGKLVTTLNFIIYYNNTLASAPFSSYYHPNDLYEIVVWGTTINGSFIDRIRVELVNPTVFSVDCITPGLWDTIAGLTILQLAIASPLPIANIEARIYVEWSYNSPVIMLNSFFFNPLSGFYEQQLDTTSLPDGQYRIECEVTDFNFQRVQDWSHFFINNPPHVEILTPINWATFQEYDPISFVVRIPDLDIDRVELWKNGTQYLMDFTPTGENWTGIWTNTMGWQGVQNLQIRAYDSGGLLNGTQWVWVQISPYIPPANQADLYKVISTNSTGGEQTIFNQGETVEYHSTIRGDIGSNTYVVTAQTDDPFLQGYLQYNDTVTVLAGQDIEVIFSYTIGIGAPSGTYMVQIIVWTDWPWNGGLCVDFITITFQVA